MSNCEKPPFLLTVLLEKYCKNDILSEECWILIIKGFRIILNTRLFTVILFMFASVTLFASAVETQYFERGNISGHEVNSILASVNGEAVSLMDVLPLTREQEYVAYASRSAAELPQVILQIRKKAVDDLIDRKLIVADYKSSQIRIPAQDIDSELDRIAVNMGAKSRHDFIARLRQSGLDYDKIRREIEEHMAVQLMLHRCSLAGNAVTPEELYSYYSKHKDEFNAPDSIELAMILVKDEEKSKLVSSKLQESPEDFASLALRFSEGPGKDNGGLLGRIEVRRLRSEFAAAMNEIVEGKVYGPVKTAEGNNYLKVIKFIPGSGNDYFSVLPKIRQKLEKELREERFAKYKESLRKKAVIRYFFIPENPELQGK